MTHQLRRTKLIGEKGKAEVGRRPETEGSVTGAKPFALMGYRVISHVFGNLSGVIPISNQRDSPPRAAH